MKKIGFIGLGIMGLPMAGHLMDAGYEMHIYARHPEKVTSLVEKGATLHSTIHDCVKDVDAVMTIVGFPQDVEEVYIDEGIISENPVYTPPFRLGNLSTAGCNFSLHPLIL